MTSEQQNRFAEAVLAGIATAATLAGVDTYAEGIGELAFSSDTFQLYVAKTQNAGEFLRVPTSKLGAVNFGIGGIIYDHYASVGNVGTGEDDLYSDTTPASLLGIDGEKIEATYQLVLTGAAAATQQFKVYFGGTVIYDSTALSIGVATNNATIEVLVIRESSSVVRCSVAISTDFATLFPYSKYTRITGLTLSGTNILKVTGEAAGVGAATDQVVATMGVVKWYGVAGV